MLAAKLMLRGAFRLEPSVGAKVDIRSRKGQALLAMLATSPSGERTRNWLQEHLWGSREREQAQASLRNEILAINRLLLASGLPPLKVTRERVGIDLDQILLVDVPGEFLEGIDIAGEETFEDWLREMRSIAMSPASTARTPTDSVGDSPSIVVLPVANDTGDPALTYLGDGTADELLHRLSRLRWLTVVTPGVPPTTPESSMDAGRRLGVRYVLSGRLTRYEAGFRLSASLIDSASGRLVWTQPYQMPAPQAEGALDGIVDKMAALLDDRIDAAEQERASRAPEMALAVNDLIWRGRWHQNRLNRDDLSKAGHYFAEAARVAPDSSLVMVEQAQHLAYRIWAERQPADTFQQIRRLAERAIQLDGEDARAHMMLGVAETWLQRSGIAEVILLRAISLNPNLPIAYEQLATLYNLAGRPGEAVAPLRRSLMLSPADFRLFYKLTELALAHLMLGEFEAAAERATQAISLRRGYWHAHVIRVNALARMGAAAPAREALADLFEARPGFLPAHIDWIPFVDRRHNRMLSEGLQLAEI